MEFKSDVLTCVWKQMTFLIYWFPKQKILYKQEIYTHTVPSWQKSWKQDDFEVWPFLLLAQMLIHDKTCYDTDCPTQNIVLNRMKLTKKIRQNPDEF